MKPGEYKILEALRKHPLTFTELQKETKLSKTALADYLKNFMEQGLITKDEETRRYYIPLAYMPLGKIPEDNAVCARFLTATVFQQGHKISKIRDRNKRREMLRIFWSFYFRSVTSFVWRLALTIPNEMIRKRVPSKRLALDGTKELKRVFSNYIIPIFSSLLYADLMNWKDHEIADEEYNKMLDLMQLEEAFKKFAEIGKILVKKKPS